MPEIELFAQRRFWTAGKMFAAQLLVLTIIVINVNAGSIADTVQVRDKCLDLLTQ